MGLLSELARFALFQTIPHAPEQMAAQAQSVVVQLAGMFVSAVVLLMAVVCLVLATVFTLLPIPATPVDIGFTVGLILALLGGVGWMLFANLKRLGAEASALLSPPRPVDLASQRVNRVVDAFLRGWERHPS